MTFICGMSLLVIASYAILEITSLSLMDEISSGVLHLGIGTLWTEFNKGLRF